MDKQTAIDLLDNLLGMVEDNHESDYDAALHMGIDALKMQLSIESTTFPVEGATLDCISRQEAILAIERNAYRREDINETEHIIKWMLDIIKWLPSVEELKSEAWDTAYLEGYTAGQNAQPKYVALHESCTDCPLYDRKNYNCPRFNKVIPRTIEEVKPRWIPIKWHNCTDEEREEYGFAEEVVAVFDCDMPNDNQEILVTTSHGYVEKDVCYIDDGYSLDSGYDWIEDIIAWMPLPEPWRGGQNETN